MSQGLEKLNEEMQGLRETEVRIETQIEMCNLITTRYNKDYSREKGFFSKVQVFILLDEFVQAIDYVGTELKRIVSISNSNSENYI